MAFRGWPAEAISFYEGLEADNSKSYFTEHKDIYESAVVAPFRELSDEIEAKFGPLRLFRPYRDVRFSKDKSPYKTAQGADGEEGGDLLRPLARRALRSSGTRLLDQLARPREVSTTQGRSCAERAVAARETPGSRSGASR
jgi:hypothetical protein